MTVTKFSIEEALSKLWEKLDSWLDTFILKLPNIAMAIITIVLFYFLAKAIRNVARKYLLTKIKQVSIQSIIAKTIFLTIVLIGFFIALGMLELDKVLTSVLAGAGVVGLAIGLALQGTLSNTVGGVVLSFMPKIRIDDYIETDETAGFVSEISLRNIVLRKPDNNYIIIPNSKFITSSFTNYSLSDRTRIVVKCGVGYECDLQTVEDMVVQLIDANFEQKEGEAVEFMFTEFGDSSINFMVRFWIDLIKSKQEHEARHKAIKLIRYKFMEENINIPFPIRTLDFAKNKLQMDNENDRELKQ